MDNDPIVISHARSLLARNPGVIAVPGDMRHPEAILTDAALTGLIDLAAPACVILSGVLHFADAGTARAVAAAFARAIAPGSYLIISVGSGTPSEGENFTSAYTAARIYIHSPEEIRSFFGDLELVPPGVGSVLSWHGDEARPGGEAAHGDLPVRRSPKALTAAAADVGADHVVVGADVVVVFLDDVHSGFLGGGPATVDARVAGEQVGHGDRVGTLVRGHQAACPRVGAVVEQEAVHVLVPRVLVALDVLQVLVVDVERDVGLLLGQELVQGLAVVLIAAPDRAGPPLRRDDAAVQRVVTRSAAERIRGVLDLVVLEVGGLVGSLVRHRQLLSPGSFAYPAPAGRCPPPLDYLRVVRVSAPPRFRRRPG